MTTMLDLAGFRLVVWQFGVWILLVLAAGLMVRRLLGRWEASTGVRMAAFSAVMSTLVSGNSSWRFFGTHLQVTDPHVRALMFATGECMQFALALMARENYMAEGSTGGGIPSLLVWVVSGVQCVPAFEEGGLAGGLVRAYLGPISAAILWHLAMGVELVHLGPADHRGGRLGRICRFLAESTMASLGLTRPDRDAEEIAKDRAVKRAVRHGLRYDLMTPKTRARRRGKRAIRRMKWAMLRAEIGTDRPRRYRLVKQLVGARSAVGLIEMELPGIWEAVRVELIETGWVEAPVQAGSRLEGAGRGEVAAVSDPLRGAEQRSREADTADTSVSALLEGLGFTAADPWAKRARGYSGYDADTVPGYADSAYPTGGGYSTGYAETFVSAAADAPLPDGAGEVLTLLAQTPAAVGQGCPSPSPPASPLPVQGLAVRSGGGGFGAGVAGLGLLGYANGTGADTTAETRAEGGPFHLSDVSASPGFFPSAASLNGPDTTADTSLQAPDTSADTPDTGPETPADTPDTPDTTVSAEEDSAPWTETRWTRATETIARAVIDDFHARRMKVTCRAWVVVVRGRGGQVASENVSALYRVACEPEIPDPGDTAD
jgi:hypothetical protein